LNMLDIEQLLVEATRMGASDLHLSSGERPIVRLGGSLVALVDYDRLEADQLDRALVRVFGQAHELEGVASGGVDSALNIRQGGRYRVNIFQHFRGLGAAFRILANTIPELESLGLPEWVSQVPQLERGLVLITGATGSGKSTTIASIIERINTSYQKHIITVEDPVEYLFSSKRSLIHQREVGKHVGSFAQALRAALREDPDVIVVGELRDLETMQLALTAAETGHLVLATLHARDAIKAVDRFIDVFPAAQQSQVRSMLSESLEGILSQTLVATANGAMRARAELVTATPAVRNLIREGKTHQLRGVMQISAGAGMVAL
jgi:twitching motility protein PilT